MAAAGASWMLRVKAVFAKAWRDIAQAFEGCEVAVTSILGCLCPDVHYMNEK